LCRDAAWVTEAGWVKDVLATKGESRRKPSGVCWARAVKGVVAAPRSVFAWRPRLGSRRRTLSWGYWRGCISAELTKEKDQITRKENVGKDGAKVEVGVGGLDGYIWKW